MGSTGESFPPPLLLAGPTAVGKTEISLFLAERLGGEIVSVDSMQVYRGLDIGTAKPTLEERRGVPHHLIDVVEVCETFDAAQFLQLAQAAVREIQARGRVPILSGGTGLYFKVFLEGLGEAPPPDPSLRAELEQTPLPDLLRELAERDPVTFEKIDRQNPRRVVRAVEVIRLSGRPFSAQRAPWQRAPAAGNPPPATFFALARERADLCRRIAARAEDQFQRGVLAETARAMALGLEQNRTAMQAIVYRQAVEHLRGKRSLAETLELVKARNRQYAKRQMTWFRHQAQVSWIQLTGQEKPEAVAAQVAEQYRRGQG